MKKVIISSIIVLSMLIGVKKVNAATHTFINNSSYSIYLDCPDEFSSFGGAKLMTCNLYTNHVAAIDQIIVGISGDGAAITGYSSGSDYYEIFDIQTGAPGRIVFKRKVFSPDMDEGLIGSINIEATRSGLKQVVLSLYDSNNVSLGNPFSKYYNPPKLTSLKINGIAQDLTSKKVSFSTVSDSVTIEAVASDGATLSGDIGTFGLQLGENKFSVIARDSVLTSFYETYEITVTNNIIGRITELQNKILELEQKMSEVYDTMDELKQQNNNLESNNQVLLEKIEVLNNQLEVVLTNIDTLKSNNVELEDKYNELQLNMKELHDLTQSILQSNGSLSKEQLEQINKLISSMLDKNNSEEPVKNPETNDKVIIFGLISITLIGSIVGLRKKIKSINV